MDNQKFKQTEIGEIPVDWEVKELGSIGEPKMCKRIMKDETSEQGDIPFFKIGTFGGTPDAFISNDTYTRYKALYSYPKKGDILLSAAGTIGRTVIYNGEPAYYQDSNIVWIDNDEKKVLNKYLYYSYSRIEWDTSTGTIPRLYNNNLKSALIPLPSTLDEQQRIAKALSDVANVISTLEKLIQKKKNIKQGVMQELLTGKKRLPGFAKSTVYKQTELGEIPEDWEIVNFESLFDICTATISTADINCEYYIGTENMLQNKMGITKNNQPVSAANVREYKENDILVSNIRPYLKKIWLASENSGCSTDVLVFRRKDKEDLPLFLYYMVSDDRFFQIVNENSVGTKMPRGDKNIIKRIVFPLPLTPEQSAIAKVLSDMDKEIDSLNKKLQKYRQLKTAMMQQLLTGKIRLV